jgi:hypothetical protein
MYVLWTAPYKIHTLDQQQNSNISDVPDSDGALALQ